ncbi:MAG TPA: cupin domain-containing protein [Candidatus Limnocylindrales bacterium]|jgi:quercetin dioxygenase-like cupin family protein
MSNLVDLADIVPIRVWDGVVARRAQGDRLTLAVVELAPDSIVSEHRHPNEQCGLVIEGEVTFRIGDEERVLGPGGTWRILGDTPHSVVTGPRGAVVIDVFAPARDDWDERPTVGTADEPAGLMWPRSRVAAERAGPAEL